MLELIPWVAPAHHLLIHLFVGDPAHHKVVL